MRRVTHLADEPDEDLPQLLLGPRHAALVLLLLMLWSTPGAGSSPAAGDHWRDSASVRPLLLLLLVALSRYRRAHRRRCIAAAGAVTAVFTGALRLRPPAAGLMRC
jgi:hypothetical protein